MTRISRVALLVASALVLVGLVPVASSAAGTTAAISSVDVTCITGGFNVAVSFTHTGAPIQVVAEKYAQVPGDYEQGSGILLKGARSGTVSLQLAGVSAPRIIVVHIYDTSRRRMTELDSWSSADHTPTTYTCPA